jgi:hypothetical protein
MRIKRARNVARVVGINSYEFLVRKRPLGTSRRREKDVYLRGIERGLISIASKWGITAGFCEHSNKH